MEEHQNIRIREAPHRVRQHRHRHRVRIRIRITTHLHTQHLLVQIQRVLRTAALLDQHLHTVLHRIQLLQVTTARLHVQHQRILRLHIAHLRTVHHLGQAVLRIAVLRTALLLILLHLEEDHDVSQGVLQDARQDVSQGASQGVLQDAKQDVPKGASQGRY